jgi:hypothetical protein
MKGLVLAARCYQFTGKDTGELIRGCTVTIVEPVDEGLPDVKGFRPLEYRADFDVFGTLPALPAVCEVEYSRRPGKGGRPETVLRSVDFVAPFEIALTKKAS